VGNDVDDEEDEEWAQTDNWENETEETDDVRDESNAYLEFLSEEGSRLGAQYRES